MEIKLTKEDRKRIEESIRQKYIKVARTRESRYPGFKMTFYESIIFEYGC